MFTESRNQCNVGKESLLKYLNKYSGTLIFYSVCPTLVLLPQPFHAASARFSKVKVSVNTAKILDAEVENGRSFKRVLLETHCP